MAKLRNPEKHRRLNHRGLNLAINIKAPTRLGGLQERGDWSMIDIASESYWDEKFEKKKEHKISFANKIIMVGLILFGICTVINTILIYKFFNLLNKV